MKIVGISCIIIVIVSLCLNYTYSKNNKKEVVNMKRGINIGNALESPKDFQWDVTLKNEYFHDIKDAGFDTVRIPVRLSDYVEDDTTYKIDEEFFTKLDNHINYALDKGLVVILDLHHFQEIMENPQENKEKFLAIWEQVSVRYKSYAKELTFELLNEPIKNLSPDLLNEYLEEGLKIIRKTNPKRTVIIGPYNYYQIDYLDQLKVPKDPNIMVSFHYYEPDYFAFQGNIYHEGYEHLKDITWTKTEEEIKYLQDRFDKVQAWAEENQVSILLGEFGITKEAPRESRKLWIETVRKEAEKRNFAWAYWELASGFGIYDGESGNWDEEILNALIEKR